MNESLLEQILNIAIGKSQSESLAIRVLSGKMLAKVCPRLNQQLFVPTILQTVHHLCNDSQPTVRAHISKQLSLLAQNLRFSLNIPIISLFNKIIFSLETIKSSIIPLLIERTNDREFIVRIAAFESIIELIPRLDQQYIRESVLPPIVLFFSSALTANDRSLGMIFMNFGKMCQTLPKQVIANEKWFLDYYFNVFLISNDFQLSPKDIGFSERDIHCRNLLALFFPVISGCFGSQFYSLSQILFQIYGPNESLNSVLNFLCCDLDITVVRTIASVFPQINSQLKSGYKLYPHLSKLMSQRSIILAKELMPFLSDLLIDVIKSAPNENKVIFF